MSLHRLVYYSSNQIMGQDDLLKSEVEQILAASRRNNELVGVTGALMFSAGFFGQVLEGDAAAIETTFERIQQDPRHGNVVLLEFKPIEARSFSNWAMAYVGPSSERFDGWSDMALDNQAIDAEKLFSRLHGLVSQAPLAA